MAIIEHQLIENKLTSILSNFEEPVSEYICGCIIDSLSTFEETNEDNDIIGELVLPLLEESGEKSADINTACELITQLVIEQKDNIKKSNSQRKDGLLKLDAPLRMNQDQAKTSLTSKILQVQRVDLNHAKGRNAVSQVDTKKLRKAEAKIAAKLEKRQLKADYEASKLIDEDENTDEFLMKVNPILDYTETKGKIKDVYLENFDISFGGKRILTNAELKLTFGRRYGLIGRNGVGKSTLLKNLSRRELPVPTFISILHVEQEMAGDDTSAIKSVLKADYFREMLLKEEVSNVGEVSNENELAKNEIGEKLNEVHRKLQEIESDKAESKAGEILNGLGFSTADFLKTTKSFSGGWRMRLSLARALFCKPDLLLLDEPTNMLDIPAVVWLERYLRTWPNSLLVVSHDRAFLDAVATDIIHQHSERLDTYKGNFSTYWATIDEKRKNQIREYESQMKMRQHLQDFIDKWRYNAKRAPQAQSKIKILEKLPVLELPETEKTVSFTFPQAEYIPPPLLYMDEVHFGYTKERPILSNVSINLEASTRVAVVGPNGAGKTTMLKLLIGSLDPSKGLVHRHGRLKIAYFSQHHVDQLDLKLTAVGHMTKMYPGKSEEEYRRHLGSFGISGMVALQKIATLSGGFSTADFLKTTKSFSGGWRMRLSLARALFCKPDLLLLDEPTNMLDIPAVVWLERYLRTWPNSLLVVSHDRAFLDAVATDIIHQHSERLDTYKGNFSTYWATIDEKRKNQIREYESQMKMRQHLQDFIDKWRYNAKRAPQAQSKIKILEKLPVLELPETEKTVSFTFPQAEYIPPPLLYMDEVHFGYTKERPILSNVSINLEASTRVAVVGPNGAGKTTMLKLLIGSLEPSKGLVHRHGRLKIAYFSQHHVDQLDLKLTAVGHMTKMYPGKSEEEYRRHLGSFGISGMVALQKIATLSGGQKSRVAFSCLAVQLPHFIILDEPTNHLDMESIDALTEGLKKFNGGLILVSHDERFINSVCTELWVCSDGKLTQFKGNGIKEYRDSICPPLED
ncbi:hypothetical protein BB561_003668 [Smittium simulii]|uniref:ABC transporter domain-containing protein n=1 Tax=Smittium simulii TaxID=133385 RepID=A0A2T9YK86_9FUNG|nr:hypothetical protein BB561_003668 [Smittium simulii]